MDTDLLGQLAAAWQAHQWLLFTAIIVGALVAAMKQGWLGTWVQNAIPATARPWLAVGLGAAGTFAVEVVAGKPWQTAVLDSLSGALSGVIAVFGHQTVVEHMRDGKELLPAKKAPPQGPSGGGGGGGPVDAKVLMRLAACFVVAALTLTTGCQAWTDFVNNPVSVAQSLAQYVEAFLASAGVK